MWKVLLLMATVANTIYIVSSVDTYTDSEQDCVEYASDSNESCGGEPYNQCPKNERWVQCPSGLCQPRNCTELGYPVPCPIQSVDGRCSTEPGCICIEGYLRNKYGVCIPKKQCPSCGGDPNAEATCRCDKLCSGQIKPCPKICNPNSCNCREGYVRDENSNKCVLPKDCTQTCGRDEVFDGCVNGGCHTGRTCEEADRLNGNEICVRPKICLPGCLCKPGYVRNNKGVCVPRNQCPTLKCGPNEELNSCANGGCHSGRVCDDLDRLNGSTICIDPIKCEPGCLCKPGYLRNRQGVCVLENRCPNSKCKLDHETYSNCPAWRCDPQSCTELGFPIACPNLLPAECPGKPGCICAQGYVRNNKGICIPVNECPSCGGDPNAVSGCGMACVKKCSNYWRNDIACILSCQLNGCSCRDGYVYDENIGKCVKYWECTPVCGQNEEYSDCTNGGCYGARDCTDDLNTPVKCVKIDPKYCKRGCVCKKGYLRNNNGVCVAIEECPVNEQCKGRNTFYDACPPSCASETCESIGKIIDCPPHAPVCRPRCRCAQGYYYDKNGECISDKDCPRPCPENEYWSGCANGGCYGPRNCSQITGPSSIRPVICVDLIQGACLGGCLCKDKLLRNDQGVCVPEDKCPRICGPNEEFDVCPGRCPARKCGIDDRKIFCPKQPNPGDKDCPPPACRCKSGFYRNDKGVCVTWNQCPPPKCNRPNEEWNPCPDTCPPQTCESIGQRYNCPNKPVDNPNCQGQCVCREGYYRNKLGDCISKDDCLRCTGPHEYYSCGGACDNKCSNYGDQNQDNCPIINIKCNEMCYCERGYARDNNGTCVPLESCRRCKGAHEYYDEFAPPNLNEYCATAGSSPRLVVDESKPRYKPTCRCEDGYLRDSNGNCIPEQKCPCYGNATWSSCGGNNCGRSCSDLNRTDPVNCVLMCFRGCECNEGYYYDINTKSCVLPKDCPQSPPQCPNPNEVYHPCPSTCPGQRCDVDPRVIRCAAPPQIGDPRCEPSCICKSDYRRDANGRCIPKEDCPCGGDPNATSSGCGSNCGRMCSDLNRTDPVICPLSCRLGGCECRKGYYFNNITQRCVLPEDCNQCKDPNAVYGCGNNCGRHCSDYNKEVMCTMDCPGGCECKKGYVLDDNTGKCVPPERCTPICNGPNEHYSCGGACDNVCATLSKQNQTHCPIINIRCNDKCYCNEGYCRDKNNICVPIKPDRACKDPNAVWSECGNDNCGRTCSSLNATDPVACIALCRVGSCECREGYYYDNNTGKCVLPKDCTSCGGDPNASWSDCGDNNCGRTCADLNRTDPVACLDMCYNGCQCKKGYYYNNVTKRCVLPEDCKICPLNERYSTCLQAECRALTCEDRGKSIACPRIRPEYCKKGCVCEEGYLRNKQGRCIPVKDCPCPGNLIWNECPGDCDADYCPRTRDDLQSCLTRNCGEQRCTCGFDQKRDRKTGNCIRTSDCPPFPCDGPNEEFQACPPLCPGDKCSDINRNCSALGHIGIVVPCRLECRCKKNYWRNSKGICVCADECREDGNNNGNNSNSSEELTKGIHDFSFDFMRTLLKTSKGKSTIASPYSVLLALAQLVLYSTGESQRQLLGALNLQNNDQVRQAFTQLTRTMRSSSDVQFAQAVKVFVNDEYRLTRAFQDDTRNVFNGTAENIDCNQPEQTANYINKWVEDQTNNKIKNLISKDVINKLLRLILVNAIYFKGKWLTQFNKNDTKDRDFYLNKDTKIQVPTMYLESRLNYAYDENLKAHFLELPYVGKEFKMVICLPSDIEGLQDTLSKLTAATMQQALNRMTTQKVRVFLPSFKVETSLDLNDLLKAIGISDIFSPEKAGLRNIVENNDQLYVSKVVHKAFIETTEEGTEAAAATAVVVKTLSLQLPIEVIANHPFLYLIMKNKNIIFTGDYNGK